MKNDSSNSIYFTYFIDLYTTYGNKEAVEEIKTIKEKYPNFPFENYEKGVFTDENIKCYGVDFLLATCKYRDVDIYSYGLKGQYEKSKVELLLLSDILKNLNNKFVVNNNFDLNQLNKISNILKELDIPEFFNSIIDTLNGVSVIKNIIDKKFEYLNILFLARNFRLIGKEHYISQYICDQKFFNFISLVDESYLNTSNSVEMFIQKYDKYSEIFINLNSQNLDTKRTNKLNAALFASYVLPFNIKTIDDIDKYYDNRYKAMCKIIRCRDIHAIKDILAKVYYNCSYKDLKMHINDAKKSFKKANYNFKNLETFFRIMELETEEEVLIFLDVIGSESNIINKIENMQKEIASRDIVDKLHCFNISKPSELVYLKGERFIFLLHKIKGFGSYEMASKIYNDPSCWLDNAENRVYILTSLCNESFFGLVEGNGYVLGFNNIPHGSVIGMGTEDIFMSRRIAENNLNNSKNRFLLAEDLVENSKKFYNEVAIKSIVGDKLITPDLVFAQDNFTDKEEEVAKLFKIPICIIDSEIYAKQMFDRQQKYLEKNELTKYIISLRKMYFSFANNYAITSKYFSLNELKTNLENIVNSILSNPIEEKIKLCELLNMVKEYGKLVDTKNYIDDSGDFLNVKEIEEKIKKRI